ncbi:MAG: hypothetical protein AB7I38_11100 [Dehalococcoidia bacterium]
MRIVVWVSWRDEAGEVHSACVSGVANGDVLEASEPAVTSCGQAVAPVSELGGERPTCPVCLEGYEERLGLAKVAVFGAEG